MAKGNIVVKLDLMDKEFRKRFTAMDKSLKKFGTDSKKTTKSVDGITASLTKLAGGFVTVAAAIKTAKIGHGMAQQFAQVQGMERGLDNLLDKYGLTAAEMMGPLHKATMGAVGDVELLRKSAMGLALGLAPEEIIKFGKIATTIAQTTGQSVGYMYESLITGTARQSKLWLDNLGILLDLDKVNKNYAETLGKTVAQLSEAERKQGFVNAVVQKGEELMTRMGGATENYNVATSRLSAQTDNLKTVLGSLFEKVLSPGITMWGNLALEINNVANAYSKLEKFEARADVVAQKRLDKTKADIVRTESEVALYEKSGTAPGYLQAQKDELAYLNKKLVIEEKLLKRERDRRKITLTTGGEDAKKKVEAVTAVTNTQTKAVEDQTKAVYELYAAQYAENAMLDQMAAKSMFTVAPNQTMATGTQDQLSTNAELDRLEGSSQEPDSFGAQMTENMAAYTEQANAATVATQAISLAVSAVGDGIATAIVDGAANWKEIFKSLLKMMISMVVQALILKAIMMAIGVPGGGIPIPIPAAHTGGVVGRGRLKKYHSGGVKKEESEIPIMAQRGEGIVNRYAMRRPGVQDAVSAFNRGGASTGGQQITNIHNSYFTIQALDGADLERTVRNKIIPLLRQESARNISFGQ